MKKQYEKPEQCVVMLQHRTTLLTSSLLDKTSTNLDPEDELILGGGGNGQGR